MKTLYISDLDGTLLNSRAELDPYVRDAINRFAESGGHFTVATARTSETVRHIMKGAKLAAPMVLMNGVFAQEQSTGRFAMSRYIDETAALKMIEIVERHRLSGFLYLGGVDRVHTYYTRLETEQSVQFKTEREQKYNKIFTKVDSYTALDTSKIVYYSICEKKELLDKAAAELKQIAGLNVIYYRDIYVNDLWYLEVCAENASKKSAVDYLRGAYGYDRIVAFGDNYNDLPLLEAADYRVAVANAVDEVKEAADRVVDSNLNHGVANYLLEQIPND